MRGVKKAHFRGGSYLVMSASFRDILVAQKCDGGRLPFTMVRRILPVFGIVLLIAACATSTFEGDDKKDGDITSSSGSTSSSSSSGSADSGKDTGSSRDGSKDTGTTSSSGTVDSGNIVDTGPVVAAKCVGADAIFTNIIALLLPTSSCAACNAQTECCFTSFLNQPYCIDKNLVP